MIAVRRAGLWAAGAILGAAGVWLALRNRRVRERRSFEIECRAAAQGVLPLAPVRARWRRRLAAVLRRHGELEAATIRARARVMLLAALAQDLAEATVQLDAVVDNANALAPDERWMVLTTVVWVERRRASREHPGRCLRLFRAIEAASEPGEIVDIALQLARVAALHGREDDARDILDRAIAWTGRDASAPTEGSPYRSAGGGAAPDRAAFALRLARVDVEVAACCPAAAHAVLADQERWLESHGPGVTAAHRVRMAVERARVQWLAGELAQADRTLADALARPADGDEAAAMRRQACLVRAELAIDALQPERAHAILAEALRDASDDAAFSAGAYAVLARAALLLGDDEEARRHLARLEAGDDATEAARALLALRAGATATALRHARAALAATDVRSPRAIEAWLTVARVLVARGNPGRAARLVRLAAGIVIGSLGPNHFALIDAYRFLAERRRVQGAHGAARSLDAAADRIDALARAEPAGA